MIVSTNSFKMNPEKVRSVAEWPIPQNLKDLLAFLEFVNFYRRLMLGFDWIAEALTDQTKTKDTTVA